MYGKPSKLTMTRVQQSLRSMVLGFLSLCLILTGLSVLTAPAVLAATSVKVDYENNWAKETIAVLLERGIISPDDSSGNVNPQLSITRAEVATAINRMYGFKRTVAIDYKDADPSASYYKDLQIARAEGYMLGDGAKVYPNNPISREELSSVIGRILKLPQGKKYASTFTDAKDIAEWSIDFVGALAKEQVLQGYPNGKFQPKSNITRAEAYAVILRSDKVLRAIANNVKDLPSVTASSNLGDGTKIRNYMNVTVTKKDVVLSGLVINGDLIISKEVADGNVALNNVTVKGITYIYGGGSHSVTMTDCNFGYMVLNSVFDTRLLFNGTGSSSTDGIISLSGGVIDVQNSLNPNLSVAAGTPKNAVVTVRGKANEINIGSPATVIIEGEVKILNAIAASGTNANIIINAVSTVSTANLSVPVIVSGSGKIITANVNSDGVVMKLDHKQDAKNQGNNNQGNNNQGNNNQGNNQNYSITVQNDGKGTASGSLTTAAAGTIVTLTAVPNAGYQFKEWQVVAGTATISGNTFVMPTENVTIKAIFEAVATTDAESPTISVQPTDIATVKGEPATFSITAHVSRGTLTYQWYEADTRTNIGGTVIPGATSDSYNASTTATGVKYYYCVVTSTDNEATGSKSATITSNAVSLQLNASIATNLFPVGDFEDDQGFATYWDYEISLQADQQKTNDGSYVFYIPYPANHTNIDMVFASGSKPITEPLATITIVEKWLNEPLNGYPTFTYTGGVTAGTYTVPAGTNVALSPTNAGAYTLENIKLSGLPVNDVHFTTRAGEAYTIEFTYFDPSVPKNLISNGNFSLGLNGWMVSGGKGLGYGLAIKDDVEHGKALEFSDAEGFSFYAGTRVPVKSGHEYTLTWWAKSELGSLTLFGENYDSEAGWDRQDSFVVSVAPAAGSGWQKFEKTFQINADGYLLVQFIYPGNGTISIADINLRNEANE